uniref:DDE Tnp4 domain-containing protein n=1 Tax=Schistocephalus solidus TaxID=70667 RepID=A0A183SGH2_SCHSO
LRNRSKKECDIEIYHFNEKRVRRRVKLERTIFDSKSKTELTRVEVEAETDVDYGDDADEVKYLERIALGAQADARVAIEECVLLPSLVAYKRARGIIGDLFGQLNTVARSLLEGLFSPVQRTTHTAKSLSDLCIKVKAYEIALRQINCCVRYQWAEVTSRISKGRRDSNFADLMEFVEARSRIAGNIP